MLVAFGDGSAASATMRLTGTDTAVLVVEAYITAAGTTVTERYWQAVLLQDGSTREITGLVVKSRLSGDGRAPST